jgi:serine/threonine-protein kinase HipA
MISETVYVWTWLPGDIEPVVAGRLDQDGEIYVFTYGRSYLGRDASIALYLPELPLIYDTIRPTGGEIAGCLEDAAPDSWGRRVILNRIAGGNTDDVAGLDIMSCLLLSGSDRIGALDFQESSTDYEPRSIDHATLEELVDSARRVEEGIPLTLSLDAALLHGTSIGGARPKALLRDGERQMIAKFSSSTDTFAIVKGEFIAMELARLAGLDAAIVELTRAHGKDVLLVDRFDRPRAGSRRAMVSAATVIETTGIAAIHGSYALLADQIRARFTNPTSTLHELFGRITFNILIGNTDDHARNQAAFWDGSMLTLTPAYDICPYLRSGGEASQAMAIGSDGYRQSQVAGVIERSATYHLDRTTATEIVHRQVTVIEDNWDEVCDRAQLTEVDRDLFRRGAVLHPYALQGFSPELT